MKMETKMKRFLGILLSIVMVFSMMPGMNLTAYADGNVPVASIDLSIDPSIFVENGKQTYIGIQIAPDNATDRTVTWSSDKPDVAVVQKTDWGPVILPLSAGTARITATANDGSGVSASCEITVFKYCEVTFSAGDKEKTYSIQDVLERAFLNDLLSDLYGDYNENIGTVTVSDANLISLEKIQPIADFPDYYYWQMIIQKPFSGTEWIKVMQGNKERIIHFTCWEPTVAQTGQNKYIRYAGVGFGFDVMGRDGDDYIQTTFADQGYQTEMKVGENEAISFDDFLFGKTYTDNGVTASIAAKIHGRNVNVTYTLTNDTNEGKTVKIGSCSDTQIGDDDKAPVFFTEDGIKMTSIDEALELKLIPGDAPFTTRWYGYCNEVSDNVFTNLNSTTPYTDDSGVAWSWTVEIPANSTVTRTAILSVGQVGTSSIVYNANGGEGEMDPTVEIPDGTTTVQLNPNRFTGGDYTFMGWDTDSAGKTVVYEDKATLVMPDEDMDLYAVWALLPQITATVTGYTGDYDGKGHGITVAVTDPASGAEVKYGTMEGTYDLTASPTITGAGDSPVTIYYRITADGYAPKTGSATVKINKIASASATVTANNRTYDGTEQELVTVDGSRLEGGTMQYALGVDEENAPTEGWNEGVPVKTDAGTYYVWYMVKGDGNHKDTDPDCVKVSIAKRNVTLTSSSDEKVYDGEVLTNEEVTVTGDGFAAGEGAAYDVTGSRTLVGVSENTFTYTLNQGTKADNYQITKAEGTLSVTKADPSGEITAVTNLVYDGEEKALVTAGETDGGSFMYRLGDDGEWQNDIPQAVDAGTYTTYYCIKGDENHKDDGSETEPKGSVETVVAKAAQGKPAENLTTEKASDEVRADGKISGFDVSKTYQYSADGGKTWKDVSGKTVNIKAGTYLIRYAEDKNHLAGSPVSVTVEADPVAQITKEEEDTLTINAGLKVTQKGSKIKVKWGKIKDADGYEIYLEYCGKTRFGSRPEKDVKSGKTSVMIKSIHGKKLNLKKNFKLYVRAYKNVNGKKVTLAKTIAAHVVGRKNKKNTNAKSITIKQPQVVLSIGATHVIKAKTNLVDKKKKQLGNSHAAEFRYASSNEQIASVDVKGKITANRKGICVIYVYSRNGLAKTVTVTVQ